MRVFIFLFDLRRIFRNLMFLIKALYFYNIFYMNIEAFKIEINNMFPLKYDLCVSVRIFQKKFVNLCIENEAVK